jgi:hypothetical protein
VGFVHSKAHPWPIRKKEKAVNDNHSFKKNLIALADRLGAWLGAWCKENVDFAFVLAVFTETPRWTVTFLAINEPLWIGVPLGVLLAFATSKVWKHYYRTRSRWALTFNILAIVLAMLVITPVLYAMMDAHPRDVDVTVVLTDWRTINPLRMTWAAGLALLTFVPLVQLAAVHGVQMPVVQNAKPIAKKAKPPAPPPDAQPTKHDRAQQLREEGLNNAQIAAELGVHRNTVPNLLRRTNGHKEPAQ